MPIHFAHLLEDGDFDELIERTLVGLIVTDEKSIAKYFAQWNKSDLAGGMHVDMIVGRVLPHEEWKGRKAVSIHCSPHGGLAIVDASKRPFAGRQALHCTFPPVDPPDEDLLITAKNIVRFVKRYDSRIPDIFRDSV